MNVRGTTAHASEHPDDPQQESQAQRHRYSDSQEYEGKAECDTYRRKQVADDHTGPTEWTGNLERPRAVERCREGRLIVEQRGMACRREGLKAMRSRPQEWESGTGANRRCSASHCSLILPRSAAFTPPGTRILEMMMTNSNAMTIPRMSSICSRNQFFLGL